ncbi:MAG: preprotein translocase subunit SecG, partial [Pirellulaceae bacterium]
MLNVFLGILLTLTCMFLIILVLLQRGRGGGLTGALGGTSQSAFGAKAGDTFTWVTVGATGFWILLCMTIILTVNRQKDISEGRDDKATIGGDDDTLSKDTSGPDSDTTDWDTTDWDTTDA